MTCEGSVPPLLAVLVLQNTRVHVSATDSSNITTDIEVSADKCLSSCTTLRVPYIYPENHHVRLRGNLNNTNFGYNIDIVEDVYWFDDYFHHFRVDRHISTFLDVWDTKNFQVQLWLRELCILNVIYINIITTLDIFANNTNVWQRYDSVRSNNKTSMINSNEVNREAQFSVLKRAVEVDNMFTWIYHDLVGITATHWYNNLFLR